MVEQADRPASLILGCHESITGGILLFGGTLTHPTASTIQSWWPNGKLG